MGFETAKPIPICTPKKSTIEAQGAVITVLSGPQEDHLSLADIAKFKNPDDPDDVVRNWLRNRNTVEFLGVWERLNNPGFNPVEFDGIRIQTGLNTFTLTPKQLEWCGKAPFDTLGPAATAEAAGEDAVPKSLRPASLWRSLRSRNHNHITSGIGAVRIDCPPWAGALRYHPWQTTASPFPTIAI